MALLLLRLSAAEQLGHKGVMAKVANLRCCRRSNSGVGAIASWRETRMRVAELIIASCILAISGVGVASAQVVDPLRVLEEARRGRLEMDKRLPREAAARRQKEKADQAAQAAAQRKLEREKAAVANGAPTPTTPLGASSASAVRTSLVSSPPAASPSHEVAGTPIPTASPANTAAASAVL